MHACASGLHGKRKRDSVPARQAQRWFAPRGCLSATVAFRRCCVLGSDQVRHTHLARSTANLIAAGGSDPMRAILQDVYGAAPEDVLRLAEIEPPSIGDDEVLV